MAANQNLFEEFKPLSKQKWIEKVEKDLKGKSLDSLRWQLGEDFIIEPFYHQDDQIGQAKIKHGQQLNNDWAIGEDFLVEDPIANNKKLLAALENGINAPRFIFSDVPSTAFFQQLFKEVIPTYIETHFSLTNQTYSGYIALIKNYHQYLQEAQIDPKDLRGSLCFLPTSEHIPTMLKECQPLLPAFRYLCLDYQQLSTDPSTVIQSLTSIVQGIDTIFQVIERDQIKTLSLTISIGTSYFIAIAKIRALKILWENLLQAYDCESIPLPIDATISPEAYGDNTNTNMIRSMTVAMSAVIGGVHRLTVLPADHQKNSSAVRIARNIQHLLKMESYMDRVIDPAAGSFYIEHLTKLFVEKAWDSFVHVSSLK